MAPLEVRYSPIKPPLSLTEKILAQKGRIEGERRQVTVMFCDLEGSTALTERLGDEKAFAIIDEIFGILTQQVHRYEGTVQEFRGDGIMALFGAPVALENAAQRAVSASLAIHQEVTKFSYRIQEETRGPAVRMRIGIHTGPVVLGTIGGDLRLEFQVIGDTVNLAARVESLAEPGTTYVSEETFKLTEGFFRFESLGKRRIKGKQSPVMVFRAITSSPLRTRFDVNAERGLTPFVGRKQELNLLLQGFEKVRRGKGKAFFIAAEAGVGKSRLLYEFIKAVSSEDIIVRQGQCLSYGKEIAYHLIQDILRASLDIREDDPERKIREKVAKGLSILGIDESSTLPFILELLYVKDCGIKDISVSPEAKKVQIIEAFKKIILKGAEVHPLIVVIEDLHWMDKSSEEIMKDFLHSIPQARVLLVCTYRPGFAPTWATKSFCQQIMLNRLSNEESSRIISHLLGLKKQEARLRDLLIDKTEGVPFYIEEFVKSLRDLKMLEMKDGEYRLVDSALNLNVPSTIQDVIMARVDSLPEGAKEVLQIGSVIEREFDYKLINRVMAVSEQELVTRLSLLLDAELLYERGVPPSSTYIFGHAFTREVLYESIISTRRKELHGQIAEATEQLYDNTIEGNYGLLAHHYLIGENYEKAAHYHQLAAKKAEKMVSFPDAIVYAERRVMCLEKLPHTSETEKDLIDARTALGLYYININYHDRAKEVVEPVLQAAIDRSYDKRLAQIYVILGSYCFLVEEDYQKALGHLQSSLKIANESDDILSLWMAHFWLGLVYIILCQFPVALHHLEKALEINTQRNNLWGVSVLKSVIASWVHGFHGEIEKGYLLSSEALQLAEQCGDIFSMAYGYFSQGCSCYYKGLFLEAKSTLWRAVSACKRINYFLLESIAKRFIADIHFELGEHELSARLYQEAISLSQYGGFMPSSINLYKLAVNRSKVIAGKEGEELRFLDSLVTRNKDKVNDGLMACYLAETLLGMGREYEGKAEKWIRKAILSDSRNEIRWSLARDHLVYGQLCQRQDRSRDAARNYGKAIEVFSACGASGWVTKVEKEISRLSPR